MGKIWVEVCLISARGLRRTSPLWKLQYYAVGWIDPNNKYCSKIDSNPVWRTKFSMLVDTSSESVNLEDLALHVEVYSREPIFLREKLQGTATVILKEFLDKYNKVNSEVSKPIEEVGSFQLRKKNSSNPQGFVDVSIRMSEEREDPTSPPGDNEGFKLTDNGSGFNLANGYKSASAYPQPQSVTPSQLQKNHQEPNLQHANPMSYPTHYSHPSVGGPSYTPAARPSYHPPRTPPPPPPPPPSNVGYIPTFLPRTDNMSPSFLNMPQSGAAPAATRNARPGFGMGVGAGALAAGAVIFGDDFMSGFDSPRGLQDPSLTISLDPPF